MSSSLARQLPPPPSPQIFFRQAPTRRSCQGIHQYTDNDDLHHSDSFNFESESASAIPDSSCTHQTSVMEQYCHDSSSSSDCTRRSILSAQDEPFTPIRNLAILNYQKRSIFTHVLAGHSESDKTYETPGKWQWATNIWKGHERVCLASTFLAIILIIVGGIVGLYFAFRTSTIHSVSSNPLQEIQHAPRIGVRLGSDLSSYGNDLISDAIAQDTPKPKAGFDVPAVVEVDCNELYTFRCGINQCLPIPVWCDGKVDCDDRTDEAEECAMNCPPRFFACLNHSSIRFDKTHDWCIPETLVCNGIPDCDDLSDEYFCRCNAEQIRCTDGICKNRTEICRGADTCISDTSEPLHCNCLDDLVSHKFCDGFPDCADNLDEIECSANCDAGDQYACWRSGYGCLHKTSVCDGIRDCANGEDEEECMRLLGDGDSIPDSIDYVGLTRPAGIVLVRRWGTEYFPVCLAPTFDFQTEQEIPTTLCNHLGYARLLYAEPLTLPKAPQNAQTKFFSLTSRLAGSDPSRFFVPMKNCQSGNVLRVHCTEMMCEPRLYRNKGVVVMENGELVIKRQEQFFPFVAQIYKRVWNSWVLRCGGVIVHPLWIITSSGCIDKNGYFKALSGPYWQGTNPKLMQSRDITMIAMPPEASTSNGRNEILLARLDRRLECHDYLRPLCLPDPSVQPAAHARLQMPPVNVTGTADLAHCVTLGWNVTSNKAANIPYPSELHVGREIQIVTPEDCSRTLWSRIQEPLADLICVRISNRESSNMLSDPGGILVCSSSDGSKWDLKGVLADYKTRVTGNFVRMYALYTRVDQHLGWILREFTNSDNVSP